MSWLKARVAVGEDVEAGDQLLGHVADERVLVLLAEAGLDHRLEEGSQPEVLGVPTRAAAATP
jgi:hypothetical protein